MSACVISRCSNKLKTKKCANQPETQKSGNLCVNKPRDCFWLFYILSYIYVLQDKRVAFLPYHALSPVERETFNARRDLLTHLGNLLRRTVVRKEYERLVREEHDDDRSEYETNLRLLTIIAPSQSSNKPVIAPTY